jgi:hypothetical protein
MLGVPKRLERRIVLCAEREAATCPFCGDQLYAMVIPGAFQEKANLFPFPLHFREYGFIGLAALFSTPK